MLTLEMFISFLICVLLFMEGEIKEHNEDLYLIKS